MEFDLSELNPIYIAGGLLGGVFAFAMMANTGKVQVGLFWRIIAFAATSVVCFFVTKFIFEKGN